MHYDPSEALARIDNDITLLTILISVYMKECPKYVEELQAACDGQNLVALGNAAHNLKGASAAIGFEVCRDMAEALEVACRQSGVKSIAYFESSTARLIHILNSCDTPLKQWINNNE